LTGRAALVSPRAKLTQQAQRLDELEAALTRALRRQLRTSSERLRWLIGRSTQASPATRLTQQVARHASLLARLQTAGPRQVRRATERLLPLVRTLNAVSPLATLDRGYAIVSVADGPIVRNAADAAPGTLIDVRLQSGRLRAKVEGKS
jgi:exodeoxyribonuclease VII large subunit